MEINTNIQKQGANGDGVPISISKLCMPIIFPIINVFTGTATSVLYYLREFPPKIFLSISASQFLSL